jgi:Fe(II)/alpha-ketoglutarate-dependent arginine beta-hydroxylase
MGRPLVTGVDLASADVDAIDGLTDQLLEAWERVHDPFVVVDRARELAGLLPEALQGVLRRFKSGASGPLLLVHGVPIEPLGATPARWTSAQDHRSSLVLLLVGEALGSSFGWSTQQEGRLIHDVVPTVGDELLQTGSNSTLALELHSEDCFHPFRGEWLGLLCLRNPACVATLVSAVDWVDLSPDEWAALREPAFPLLADLSHQPSHGAHPDSSHVAIAPSPEAEYVPTLEWEAQRGVESIRFDPDFTGPPLTPRHVAALDALIAQLGRNCVEITLEPGDLLLIDNHRTVHGRASFEATYGHDERWLKRVCITADLDRSRSARHSAACRVVGCDGSTCSALLDLTRAT